MAGMARLIDKTGMRIGSEKATDTNHTYGLTTLSKKHVELDGSHFDIHYHGKGNVEIDTEGRDEIAAQVIAHCAEIPGQRLFKYQDDNGDVHQIGSSQFNQFLKEQMGDHFSAKDFRTWRFSVLFLEALMRECKKTDKVVLKNILEDVSKQSGNTPSVLQSSYVHPVLIQKAKDEDCKNLSDDFESKPNLLKAESIFLSLIS